MIPWKWSKSPYIIKIDKQIRWCKKSIKRHICALSTMPLFFARILLEKEILGRGINSGDKVILNRSGAGPSNFFFLKKHQSKLKGYSIFRRIFLHWLINCSNFSSGASCEVFRVCMPNWKTRHIPAWVKVKKRGYSNLDRVF